MRHLLIFFILFFSLNSFGQCFHFTLQITNPSCPGCCDGSASVTNLTGGCAPYMYNWAPGSEATSSIHYLCPGAYYYVRISDSGHCCADSTTSFCMDCPTGMSSPISVSSPPMIYTFDNVLTIKNLSPGNIIELYDLEGRRMFRTLPVDSNKEIDIAAMAGGIYLLIVNDKNNVNLIRRKVFR
jgi:hypothetical protein